MVACQLLEREQGQNGSAHIKPPSVPPAFCGILTIFKVLHRVPNTGGSSQSLTTRVAEVEFDDSRFERSAAVFDNPDHVNMASIFWGDRPCRGRARIGEFDRGINTFSATTEPTIAFEDDAEGASHRSPVLTRRSSPVNLALVLVHFDYWGCWEAARPIADKRPSRRSCVSPDEFSTPSLSVTAKASPLPATAKPSTFSRT